MAWEPDKPQLWYEMAADLLVLDPTLTHEQIAAQIGIHVGHFNTVARTDMFKAIVERRRAHVSGKVDNAYISRLEGKVGNLAELAVDTATEELQRSRAKLNASVQQGTLETCEMALRAIGLIGRNAERSAPPTPAHVTVIVDNTILAGARQKMRQMHARPNGHNGAEVEDTYLLPAPAQLP